MSLAPTDDLTLEAGTVALCSACFKIRRALLRLGGELNPEPLCVVCPFADAYRALATGPAGVPVS